MDVMKNKLLEIGLIFILCESLASLLVFVVPFLIFVLPGVCLDLSRTRTWPVCMHHATPPGVSLGR